ncbi:MAG: hypothetical protein ACKOBN_05655 [Flavobacteriales bacterium]
MERITSLLLLVLVLTFACEKGTGTFVIKGKITDNTFSTGLSGAELKFYKVPIGTSEEILVDVLSLPQDGSYEFKVPREKIERYIIRIFKTNYFPIEKEVYYSELSIKEPKEINLNTDAMSWVQIHFKNNNPSNLDHFRYIKQEGLTGCESCCPSIAQDFYGPLDTTFYCINKANSTYSILYWELGTPNNGLKSAFTTPFDTAQIEVLY